MDTLRITEAQLSPLDQIRQTEADVTRQIAAARETAECKVVEARNQVKGLLEDARATGSRQGQMHYKVSLTKAEEEARALVAQSHNQAKDLRHKGERRMSSAVRHAENLVIGLDGSSEDK